MGEYIERVEIYTNYWNAGTSQWSFEKYIGQDIISPIKFKWGMFSPEDPTNRMADIGTCSFVLNNKEKEYSPENEARRGDILERGQQIVFLFHTREPYEAWGWKGYVEDLKFNYPLDDIPTVEVTCVDWMNKLSHFALPLIEIQYDIYANDAVDDMLWLMDAQGETNIQSLLLDNGTKLFSMLYDDAKRGASAYSELYKVVMSELGYLYMRQVYNHEYYFVTKCPADCMILEDASHRTNMGYRAYPLSYEESGDLLFEDTGGRTFTAITEDGYTLILDESTTTWLVDEVIDTKTEYGTNLITQFSVKSYPRYLDLYPSGSVVLFNLDNPFQLAVGETKNIKFTYKDPRGSNQRVNGRYMITPVPTTDYKMYKNEDGSGTNLTAYLTVTTIDINGNPADFGSGGAIYSCFNDGAEDAWVTFLTARGYGIYFDNPVETLISDSDAIGKYGTVQVVFDQKYISEPTSAIEYSEMILGRESVPRKVLRSITFMPNTSPALMQMFTYHDIGDMVHITLNKEGFSGAYFIHGIEIEIGVDGIIYETWTLKDSETFNYHFFTLDDPVYGLLNNGNVFGF